VEARVLKVREIVIAGKALIGLRFCRFVYPPYYGPERPRFTGAIR